MTTGRQLVLDAMSLKPVERVPWVPFVGVHAGKLLGISADAVLRSADQVVSGLIAARQRYQADGLPLVFDLQIEAEILGCELRWAKDVPPSVVSHPLLTRKIADLPVFSVERGRFPIALDVARKARRAFGDEIALYGLITGPFTLASHLLGSDIFLRMFDDPEGVLEVLDFCAKVGVASAQAYLENGADVVAVVDPMTSQVSPKHFATFVTPYVNRIFDSVRAKGGKSSFFVCGDATRNLQNMCETTCDNISIDENISLPRLRDLAVARHKSFGGNMKLTVVLLLGTPTDAKLDAIRCLDEAANAPGFILAPGCDLPFDTPPANLEAIAPVVRDPYQREVARSLTSAFAVTIPAVPDYTANRTTVTVDVVTLDSAGCAPCQYMMNAVNAAVVGFGAKVTVNEHKVKSHAGIGMMCALKVSNIPTICIDGEIAFVSIIPDSVTLTQAVEARLKAKQLV